MKNWNRELDIILTPCLFSKINKEICFYAEMQDRGKLHKELYRELDNRLWDELDDFLKNWILR